MNRFTASSLTTARALSVPAAVRMQGDAALVNLGVCAQVVAGVQACVGMCQGVQAPQAAGRLTR